MGVRVSHSIKFLIIFCYLFIDQSRVCCCCLVEPRDLLRECFSIGDLPSSGTISVTTSRYRDTAATAFGRFLLGVFPHSISSSREFGKPCLSPCFRCPGPGTDATLCENATPTSVVIREPRRRLPSRRLATPFLECAQTPHLSLLFVFQPIALSPSLRIFSTMSRCHESGQ